MKLTGKKSKNLNFRDGRTSKQITNHLETSNKIEVGKQQPKIIKTRVEVDQN